MGTLPSTAEVTRRRRPPRIIIGNHQFARCATTTLDRVSVSSTEQQQQRSLCSGCQTDVSVPLPAAPPTASRRVPCRDGGTRAGHTRVTGDVIELVCHRGVSKAARRVRLEACVVERRSLRACRLRQTVITAQ